MLVNDRARVLSSTAVSYSGSPLELRDWLHDLAALTGATVVDRVAGMEPAQFRAEWLGSARKIQVSASQTVLWGYPEADARLDARIAELNGRAERTPHDHERDRLRARAANLDGGLCTLKIGGYTSPQAQERRARAEDTLHAVRTCLSTGVVPGAGAAYAWVAHHLDTSPGEDLLAEALRTPRDVLARRAGVAPAVVRTQDSAHYAEDPTGWTGWDPVERRWRRLDQGAAVLDSAGVVEAALESAVSVASTLLSTGALLTRSR